MTITATERIARLNDRCRQGLDANARIMVTRNCLARLSGEGEGIAEILAQLEFGSDDPADASITRLVLTVMLAEDY